MWPPFAVSSATMESTLARYASAPFSATKSLSQVPSPTMKKSGWYFAMAFVQMSWTPSGWVRPSPG